MINKEALLSVAAEARKASYAPYSGFAVGAAVLDENGNIFTGCNIENAAFGETCCAERVAIFKAVSSSSSRFKAIAVVGASKDASPDKPCTPCGSCRQVLAEFCNDDMIVLSNGLETTLGTLLPEAFRLKG